MREVEEASVDCVLTGPFGTFLYPFLSPIPLVQRCVCAHRLTQSRIKVVVSLFSYAFKFPISGPVLYITICCRLISGPGWKSLSAAGFFSPLSCNCFCFPNWTTQMKNCENDNSMVITAGLPMTSEDGPRYLQTTRAGTVAECVCRHIVYAFDIFFFFSSRHGHCTWISVNVKTTQILLGWWRRLCRDGFDTLQHNKPLLPHTPLRCNFCVRFVALNWKGENKVPENFKKKPVDSAKVGRFFWLSFPADIYISVVCVCVRNITKESGGQAFDGQRKS